MDPVSILSSLVGPITSWVLKKMDRTPMVVFKVSDAESTARLVQYSTDQSVATLELQLKGKFTNDSLEDSVVTGIDVDLIEKRLFHIQSKLGTMAAKKVLRVSNTTPYEIDMNKGIKTERRSITDDHWLWGYINLPSKLKDKLGSRHGLVVTVHALGQRDNREYVPVNWDSARERGKPRRTRFLKQPCEHNP